MGAHQCPLEALLCRATAGCLAAAALSSRFGVAVLAGREKGEESGFFHMISLQKSAFPPLLPAIMTIQRVPDRVLKDAYSFTVHQA